MRTSPFSPPLRGRAREGGATRRALSIGVLMASTRCCRSRASIQRHRCGYPPPRPSPASAGESHMDFRALLHCLARWILRTTPTRQRESNGEAQESFSTVVGPAGGQCPSRLGGSIGYRAGGGPVRSRDLLGHGGVWTGQGRAVAAVSAPGAWDSEPRHLQSCVPFARTRSLRSRIPALHGGVCQGQPAQSYRRGGGRRQGVARGLRARFALPTAAHGQRLCGGGANVSCAAEGSWPQRDKGALEVLALLSLEGSIVTAD